MEFLGLLGLLGLLGFFSSRGMNERFSELKDFVRRSGGNTSAVEARVADNERVISEIAGELRRLNSLLQDRATNGDLNKISTRLQKDVQAALSQIPDALARLDALERKPAPAQISDATLKMIDSRLAALEQKLPPSPVPDSALKKLETRIVSLEQNPAPTQIPDALLSRITFTEQKIAALEQRMNAPAPKVSETPPAQKIPAPPPVQVPAPKVQEIRETKSEPKITAPLKISALQIRKSDKPLFSNNPADAAKALEVIENLAPLTDFLEKSGFDKKDSFIRIVKKYQQNLGNFAKNLQRGKFDADAFSEEATDAFFSTLSKYFLATIPVSIYRGSRENPAFYSAFLAKVNAYLAACRVYTELVEPGKLMRSGDIDTMSIVQKDTPAPAKDKIIDEVERLPYFIDYLIDDEIEHFCYEGKMVVLRFNGGAK